jgi:hypothetical protein
MIEVVQEPRPDLTAYASVPIAFQIREVARIPANAIGATRLDVERIAVPYVKDYDASGNGPLSWSSCFDLSHWTFFAAHADGERVGGAVVVYRAPELLWYKRLTSVSA